MRKKLLNNWSLKLASLVLAIILWFLVAQIDDPQERRFFSNIKVNLINTELLDEEDKVYGILDNTDTIRVTVWAPNSVFSQIDESDIVAEADVSKLTEINTIPIDVRVNNSGVLSVESNRDVLRLNVEDRSRTYVPLSYDITGEAADGYIVGNVSLDQNMIEISGPESAVSSVKSAGVVINVANASNTLSAEMEVRLYDQDGNVVNYDTIHKQSDYVRVSVEILATKTVPVEVGYVGEPADGFLTTGAVECSPATVQIAGTRTALANVNKIVIPEDAINIADADSDVKISVNFKEYLQDNVRLADSDFDGKVTITVYIEPIAERSLEILSGNINLVNPPEGMGAALAEDTARYTLRVSGLEAEVSQLVAEEIWGTVNIGQWMEDQELSSLKAGTYDMPVEFALDRDVNIMEPLVVGVEVSAYTDEE
ncbi:MAG: CdaR family protein [Candidatus Gastranaerophilales bacterium]|nr:CdaR family protein [Candidatus Gastranaerophilales bacterium]